MRGGCFWHTVQRHLLTDIFNCSPGELGPVPPGSFWGSLAPRWTDKSSASMDQSAIRKRKVFMHNYKLILVLRELSYRPADMNGKTSLVTTGPLAICHYLCVLDLHLWLVQCLKYTFVSFCPSVLVLSPTLLLPGQYFLLRFQVFVNHFEIILAVTSKNEYHTPLPSGCTCSIL